MKGSKAIGIPISTSCKLDKDEGGKNIDSKFYRDMIDSLLSLTTSRPDIMLSVCLCARFQSNPKESYVNAVKKILRYLKGTQTLGLWYFKDSLIDLIGYSDVDFAGCKLDKKVLVKLINFYELI